MIINLSNHPSSKWSPEQLTAAGVYGNICDYSFPDVPPESDSTEITDLGERIATEIRRMKPAAVMCQGESTLCYVVVKKLIESNIKVLAACSKREVVEEKTENGDSKKIAIFKFVKFREYA